MTVFLMMESPSKPSLMIREQSFKLWLALFSTLLFFLLPKIGLSQNISHVTYKVRIEDYDITFKKIEKLLEENGQFSKAVLLAENTILGEEQDFEKFDQQINDLARFVEYHQNTQHTIKYNQPDSLYYLKNNSIFSTLFDTLTVLYNSRIYTTDTILFSYKADDMPKQAESENMCVTDLLNNRKGNCHSLSYLYKIIADKIGAKCWLALAPNHIYIKNFSQQYGWYNTELTSRSFPSDAWIMASGYISADAVRSKIYMDTLSNQQSIGLCVLDLAKAYEYEARNYYDGFILKCCDLVLQYHATNPMALLLKAETLKKVYLKQKKENAPTAKQAYDEMEAAYITLAKLHYREMPKEMYDKWVKQMQQENKNK
ncbi:MAG: hypothetical protein QM763_09420 [Agriterribacter sp.]